ncbi:type VI immunity family protein [Corallococcus sp. CA047B]|uniref:type VI immunity family protein n=1 Tax=Corallococcus sp. CA047B TaxID=2316729 RepID=UPI0011C38E77|nr:type VI immunity family protein [Corallococcus sp. CA047B]
MVRVVFYLPHDHKALAPVMQQLLDTYLHHIGDARSKLTTGYNPDINEDWIPLTASTWKIIREHLERPRFGYLDDMDEDSTWFWVLTKRGFDTWMQLTGDPFDPSGHEFRYISRLPWREPSSEHSRLSVSVPIRFITDHGPDKVRELALALAEHLPFTTGHAGLSLSFTRGESRLLPLLKDQLIRHPGWDVPIAGTTVHLGNQIDGVHWLNFLGPSVLEAVGGAQTLRSRLSAPDTTVQELTGGRALVTLGAAPLAGDTKMDEPEPLLAYRELARVLEPWLQPFYPFNTWSDFTEEETRRWWRRFLD